MGVLIGYDQLRCWKCTCFFYSATWWKPIPLVSPWSLKKLFALDPEVFHGINMVLSMPSFSCETHLRMADTSPLLTPVFTTYTFLFCYNHCGARSANPRPRIISLRAAILDLTENSWGSLINLTKLLPLHTFPHMCLCGVSLVPPLTLPDPYTQR